MSTYTTISTQRSATEVQRPHGLASSRWATQVESGFDVISEPKPQPKPEPKSEPRSQGLSSSRWATPAASAPEAKPEPQPGQGLASSRWATQAESAPEVTPKPKPSPEPLGQELASSRWAAQAEPALKAIPKPTPEAKSKPRTELKPQSQSQPQPEPRSQGLGASRWATQVESVLATMPKLKSEPKPQPQFGPKLKFKPEPKPEPKFKQSMAERDIRQQTWCSLFGNKVPEEPVCGPFEMRLPRSLSAEYFILGPGGSQLQRINELIPDQLEISLAYKTPKKMPADLAEYQEAPYPERLIMGFSPRVTAPALHINQKLIRGLWDEIERWAEIVWKGKPTRLDTHLSNGIKVFEADTIAGTGQINSALKQAYKAAEENAFYIRDSIQREMEAIIAAEPEIRAIARDENGADFVKAEMEKWVFAKGDKEAEHRLRVCQYAWMDCEASEDYAFITYCLRDMGKKLGY
ncbi:hypothetical protein AK830_g11796 [Neonectria ditissima]|uniref:Uncharacterized protein n=1 Tax=Neonectria ditissima TaxID=78410 RepID=A0A0P7B0I2_9HYPO|nr:hypothetical protein AK830_g11796 [Neonectria ditissima]